MESRFLETRIKKEKLNNEIISKLVNEQKSCIKNLTAVNCQP